jgi:hypothetical protein
MVCCVGLPPPIKKLILLMSTLELWSLMLLLFFCCSGLFAPFGSCTKNYEYSCRKFALYLILYTILSTYVCCYAYDITSVDAAVASLNDVVKDALDVAILRGLIAKSKFLDWPHGSSRYYDRKKNYVYRRFKKKKSDYLYSKFSFYHKLVKASTKSD